MDSEGKKFGRGQVEYSLRVQSPQERNPKTQNIGSKAIKGRVKKGGRKNLKRAAEDRNLSIQDGQNIVQVVSLRGSNLIEVMDAKGDRLLALFPAKFQKSMWIKRGSFVVVDESGKEKALESGNKVACIVSQVLFHEQVRILQKSPDWPEIFKSAAYEDLNDNAHLSTSQQDKIMHKDTSREEENDFSSSDDDGLPPLEANLNRIRPVRWQSDSESDESSE